MVDGKLAYDVYGDRWSRFTFLIYLNDDFDGGAATFYTPSERPLNCAAKLRPPDAPLLRCILQRATPGARPMQGRKSARMRMGPAAPHACAHGWAWAAAVQA